MTIEYNVFSFNGKSTADFTCDIAVEKSNVFSLNSTKTELKDIEQRNGSAVRTNRHRGDLVKPFKLYVIRPSPSDKREIKKWLSVDKGRLETFEETDVFFKVKKVIMNQSEMDEFDSYELDLQFICEPTSFMKENGAVVFASNGTLALKGSALAYPLIHIHGNSNSETRLTIGANTIVLKKLDTKVTLDCSPEVGAIFDKQGQILNEAWKGYLFEFDPLTKSSLGVVLGPEISKVEIVPNWGWIE